MKNNSVILSSADPLAVLFDNQAEPRHRARVGVALLKNTPAADYERGEAIQQGLELLLPECDSRLRTKVHAAILRYGTRSQKAAGPRIDIRDDSPETQKLITEHYSHPVYCVWYDVNRNTERFVNQRRLEWLEHQNTKFRALWRPDAPAALIAEAEALLDALPDADFNLAPGEDADALPWRAELLARRAKDGWRPPE